jgi:hypothetical protein
MEVVVEIVAERRIPWNPPAHALPERRSLDQRRTGDEGKCSIADMEIER